MNISNKISESDNKDNESCRDVSNRDSLILPVVATEQSSPYLLSSLQKTNIVIKNMPRKLYNTVVCHSLNPSPLAAVCTEQYQEFSSTLQINQEEALRGVSLEALSHIMQSSCHPASSQFAPMTDKFTHSPSTSYPGNSCTIQTYNNNQEKTGASAAADINVKSNNDNTCAVCKLNFSSASELISHRQTVHAEQMKRSELSNQGKDFNLADQPKRKRMFPCDVCGAEFDTNFDLKGHSAKHNRPPHNINQEEALRGVSLEALSHIMQSSCHPASSQFALMTDKFTPSPLTPYPGNSCTIQTYNNTQEKTGASAAADINVKSNNDNTCAVCKLNFSSASELISHRQTVHAEQMKRSELSNQGKDFILSDQPKRKRMFPCDVCGAEFDTMFDLKAHSVKHTGFSHNINQVEALRQVNLETLNHMIQSSCNPTTSHFGLMSASYNQPSSSFQSTPCNVQTFSTAQEKTSEAPVAEAVYSDDEEKSPNNDVVVMCSVCKMSFPSASQLLSHRRTVHRGQISCEFCGKNFANTHNLKIHSFSHTGDNRLKSFCDSCGKGFIKPSDLKRHELIHAGRYSCLECNITFSTADEVKEHSKTHEEFSSNCNDCNKDFINEQSVTGVQERSQGELFTCDTCGLSLDNKYDFKAHLLKHTGPGSSQNVCETCGKTFSRPSDLSRHTVIHTGQRPFTCSECNMSFGNQSNLRMHIMTHSDVKPHPCTVCEKSFRRSADLERHACTHSGERPFACNLCPMGFTTSYNLKIHQLKHSGDLPYPCSICEKAFSKPSELQRHNLIHTGERPFSCSQCGMNFSNSSNLRNHMITHSGRRPYPCSICKKAFTRPSDVKRHVLTHTGARPFACQICGLAFADSSNLKKHTLTHSRLMNHYRISMPPLRCQICDVLCNTSAELDSHVRDSHSDGTKEFLTKLNNTKQYTCAICGLRFAHAIHLQEHSLVHDREHSFQCEICDKSFAQELFLQRHLLTHTEARPYECPECFKCFKSSSHLKNHIPIHSGVKPYVCGTCNKAFLKNASLRRHQTIHARGNTVSCNICGKSFLNMEYLKKHSITHES